MTELFIKEELNQLIADKKRIVILTHKSPDGDAIGSSLGLLRALENSGREVSLLLNGTISDTLSWMPGSERAIPIETDPKRSQELLAQADLCFFLDFNIESRMGRPLVDWVAETLQARSLPTVMIDHHPAPSTQVDLLYSDTTKSATAELVGELLGFPHRPHPCCDAEVATCLYTGILTDTGLFKHNCYRPDLYDMVASLIRRGAEHEKIVENTFHSDKIARQKLLGYVLNQKIEYDVEHKWAIFALSRDEMNSFGLSDADTDGLVNIPLEARGIEMSVFVRELAPGEIKLSLRSVGDWAVNRVAQKAFGGGGHRNAAGAEYSGTLQRACEIVSEHLLQLYHEPLSE